MAISRVTAVWSGWSGAPGYTNFFFEAFGPGDLVDLEVERVRSALSAISSILPNSVTIQVQEEVSFFDETTGELLGYNNATTVPNEISGSGGADFSAASGAVVSWNTDTVARGRRIRGRTFIVPMAVDEYDSDGTLGYQALLQLRAMGDAMIGDGTGPQFVIWSRARAGSGGTAGIVTQHRVADKVAVLRSRRD